MELKLVHADPKYSAVKLIEPTTLGYIHIASEVHPRAMPFLPNGREKSELLKKSFRNYMLANLAANRVGAMPVLYRLA